MPEESLARKLNLKPGTPARIFGKPGDVDLGDVEVADDAEAVIVFATNRAELDERIGPAKEAALADNIAWVAYPKAGQLGTDLNRDLLWKHLEGQGIRPVRQVSLDAVWSGLRFRPSK